MRPAALQPPRGNMSIPATANGTAARNPTSAADGNGTSVRWINSYHDQMTCPDPQQNAERPTSVQTRRSLPAVLIAATQQARAATSAATAVPMSET